jgi:hypothetical protein
VKRKDLVRNCPQDNAKRGKKIKKRITTSQQEVVTLVVTAHWRKRTDTPITIQPQYMVVVKEGCYVTASPRYVTPYP